MKATSVVLFSVLVIALPFVVYYGYQSTRDLKYPPENVERRANLWDCAHGLGLVFLYLVGVVFFIIDILH